MIFQLDLNKYIANTQLRFAYILFGIALFTAGQANGQCELDKFQAKGGEIGQGFGSVLDVSADGSTVVMGESGNSQAGSSAGTAYVFVYDNVKAGWIQQARLDGSHVDQFDRFGSSATISDDGNLILIGASDDDISGNNSGSAYIFARNENGWNEVAWLVPEDAEPNDRFGASANFAGMGNSVLVGSLNNDTYVYKFANGKWGLQHKLQPPIDIGGWFGQTVALNYEGDTAIVGSPNSNSGYAVIYTLVENEWSIQMILANPNPGASNMFGQALAISNSGDTVIAGSSGQAYVFVRQGFTWFMQEELDPFASDPAQSFGSSVAISGVGNKILVGDWGGSEIFQGEGGAYLFSRDINAWLPIKKILPFDRDAFDAFGKSVAISSDGALAFIGASETFLSVFGMGSAYAYALTGSDSDLDGVLDLCDNCVNHQNPNQEDCDGDGIGDICAIADKISQDCNNNSVPDQCELEVVSESVYIVDDGSQEIQLGVGNGGEIIWLNRFDVVENAQEIVAVEIAWGNVAQDTPTDIAIWRDPNNDGNPSDAQLLTLVESVPSSNPEANLLTTFPIPPTLVGDLGDSFFVGVRITNKPGEFPTALDTSSQSHGRSWVAVGGNVEDLSDNFSLQLVDAIGFPGNWLIRAHREITPDCNDNGVLDECDISSGTSQDVNANGVPDECDADLNDDGSVGTADLLILLANWGPCDNPQAPCQSDLNDDGTVGTGDLLILLANWG